MMKRILAMLSLAFLFGQANAQCSTCVKITWTFGPGAATAALAGQPTGTSITDVVDQWTTDMNNWAGGNANTASGETTQYSRGGVDTSTCCGTMATSLTPNAAGADPLLWAQNNAFTNRYRDQQGGDMTIVVMTTGGGVAGQRTLVDCTATGQKAARSKVGGININAVGQFLINLKELVTQMQCATAADSYQWMTGTSSSNCAVYKTLNAPSGGMTGRVYYANEGGLSVVGYSEFSFDGANANMAQSCPTAPAGVYTYTCAPTGTCSVASITSATCTHNRTTLDTRGPPQCGGPSPQPPCSTTAAVTATAGSNSFTCNFVFPTGFSSNPLRSLNGHPMGTGTKNTAAKVDADTANTSQNHINFKVYPHIIPDSMYN